MKSGNYDPIELIVKQQLKTLKKSINNRQIQKEAWVDQGAKKIIFTACHWGKLKLAFASQDVISTSPKSFFTSRIDFTVLLLFKLLKK